MLPCIYQWHTCSSSASSINHTQPTVPLFALMKGKAQNITFYLLYTEVVWPLTNSFDIYQKVQLEKSSVLHPNPYRKMSSGSCGKNWTWDPQISQTWSFNHITTFTKPLAMLPYRSSLSHAILPFSHATSPLSHHCFSSQPHSITPQPCCLSQARSLYWSSLLQVQTTWQGLSWQQVTEHWSFVVLLVLDFLALLLHSEDEIIIGNTALCISHCADLSKMQLIPWACVWYAMVNAKQGSKCLVRFNHSHIQQIWREYYYFFN